jgi:O-antigen/teichoic acid export membrane protein
VAYVVRIVITFFFVPFITSVLGDARYGVWVIVFQTINYFTLLDLGLTSAITRYVSKYLSEKNYPAINRVLNTSTLLYFVIGTIVAAGIYLFATLFFDYFRVGDPQMLEEGRRALIILGAFMAFNFYFLPFGNSLGAFQRFDLARGLAVGEEVLRTIVMVWLLRKGYGLESLATTLLLFTIIRHVVSVVLLRRLFPEVRPGRGFIDKETAGLLFRYSRVSFAIVAGWLIIFNTDVFLLGLVGSSAAAGVYQPGAQLLLYVRNAVNAIAQPLTPMVSHLEATKGVEAVKKLYLKSLRYVSFLSFMLSAGVILYAHDFVALWLMPEFGAAADVMQVLAVGSAVFLPQIIGNAVLFGIGKHRFILYVVICEAAAKIILAIMLIKPYGLLGMAIASAAPQSILYLTLYPYFMARVLSISYTRLIGRVLGAGLVAAAVTVAIGMGMRILLPPLNWSSFAFNIVVVLAGSILVAWLVVEPEDKDWLRRRMFG